MSTFEYTPKGVCSRKMIFDIAEDGTINDLQVIGGCNGNLKGIGQLVRGRKVSEVAGLLEGITCGPKPTSCPDQISKALRAYQNA
ncbi:MAG: TIGR03905 family TSCPD domain-containing protein [Solobacterium sp.]|nr:TIGR03905 family TSCPD domain-containing protein [Solobacterium sp.]